MCKFVCLHESCRRERPLSAIMGARWTILADFPSVWDPRDVILGSRGAHFGMVGPIRGQDAPRSAIWRPQTSSRDPPRARSVPKGTARGAQMAPNHDSGGPKSCFWRCARPKVPMCVFLRLRACGGVKVHFLRNAKPL